MSVCVCVCVCVCEKESVQGESVGTRGECGDKGRVWGQGESVGTGLLTESMLV